MSIGLLLLALVLGGIALTVTAARRRANTDPTGDDGGEPRAQAVRRAFQYIVLYALMLAAASGAADLLGRGLGKPAPWDDGADVLAQSLVFTAIALPLALALAAWTWRSHRSNPREQDSLLFIAYLSAAALTGLVMALTALYGVLLALLAGEGVDPAATGDLVAWGALWAGHWTLCRRLLDERTAVGHDLLGSGIGLVIGAAGLLTMITSSIDLIRGLPLIAGPRYELPAAAALLLAGAAAWTLYWARGGAKLPRTTAWHTYVLLVGVAGGLVTALVGAQGLLWRLLVEIAGEPDQFGYAIGWPGELAAVIVGVALWWYHRTALTGTPQNPVREVYRYLVGGVGLVAAATGVGIVVVALIESLTPAMSTSTTPRNTLLAAVTLLVIGAPLWGWQWRRSRRDLARTPEAAAAAPRRVYFALVLGISGIAGLIALIVAAASVVQDGVEGNLTPGSVYAIRVPLGVLVAVAAAAGYHVSALRSDRPAIAPAQGELARGVPGRRRPITLVGPEDPGLVAEVEGVTGARVTALKVAGEGPAWNAAELLAAVDGEGDLVVIAAPAGVQVHVLETA